MTFTADDVNGRHALFSKDASGNADGGHLTAFVHDGRIEVRLQSVNESIWLKSSTSKSKDAPPGIFGGEPNDVSR